MGKRIFWIFILTVALATTAAVIYIQSEAFARIVRSNLQNKVAKNLGVELSFERLKIGVLPPSLSLLNVDVKVARPDNKLGLAPDTVFKAGSLGFSFRMIQAFSRGIAVNKVFLSDAIVKLTIPHGKNHDEPGEKLSSLVHRPIRLPLSDNFFATIRQLELRNTELHLAWSEGGQPARADARNISYLALTPSSDGTNIVLNAEDLDFQAAKTKQVIKAIKLNADVQRGLILVSNLDLQRREAALHASGKLVGLIDNILEAKPDVDVIVRGPVSEFSDIDKTFDAFGGEILADAKVVGQLKNPAVQGKVEVRNFRYGLWDLEKVELNGSYADGLVVVDSFGVNHAGGRAFLKNKLELHVPFQATPAAFQLRLEKLRFEEFAGDLKKTVDNLKMELDGTVNARLEFENNKGKVKLGSLTLQPNLDVRELELNNQTLKEKRPYHRVFKVEPFHLNGNVQVEGGDVTVENAKLAFATGVLNVNGQVTKDEGFDLHGVSPAINVGKEAGEISGIPVTGEGALAVHVLGPSEAVKIHFDVNQQNASFLHFDFGKLEGRITYDDDKNQIVITNVNGRKGSAAYTANGSVDLTSQDKIAINVKFGESAPDDLFAIFQHQLEHISWLPRGMTGTIRGEALVGGKYTDALNTLAIDAQLTGRNLSYQGEIFQDLTARAGLSNGVAFGHDIVAHKYETPYTANVDYNFRTEEMRYKLHADNGKLRGLDFLTSAGIPLDGIYALDSEGHGKWETLVSKTRIDVGNAFVRTRPLPPLAFTYDTNAEKSKFSAQMGPNATVGGEISRSAKGDSYAQVNLDRANFDFLLCMVSRANCNDGALNLTATAEARLRWLGGNWENMNGTGALQDILVAKTGYSLHLSSAVPVTAVNGLLETGNGTLEGEDSRIGFHFRGRANGTALDESVRGTGSLKLLEFITPLIEEARGKMRFELGLTGDLRNGAFRGGIHTEEGSIRVSGLDAPIENLDVHLRLNNSRLDIERFNGQLGGGTVQASGGMDIYLNRPPRFGIDLFLANNRIKFYPVNYAELSEGKLSFTGDKPPYLFSGTVRGKRVMMRNNFDVGGNQKGLQNAKYLPEKVAGAKSFYEVRIRALADGGIFVENNLLNAEFRGEVTLLNNFEFPEIVGQAELVRGKLLFRNSSFALDYASIRMPKPEVFNPIFSLGGVADVDAYRITIVASGTADRPKFTFSSYPALPQEDIVSLLAFGYRGEDARKINPNDTTAITYSEVGSILLDQLQLSQNLQSKGLRVSVQPSVLDTEANIIRPNSAATAAPKVYVQSQVAKNLDAVLGGAMGAAAGQDLDAKLEYRLGRKASMRGVYEQTPSGLDATETRNSYGADLKFRWEFK